MNTFINGKSQTPLSDFLLRGGAAVHRLGHDHDFNNFLRGNKVRVYKMTQDLMALKCEHRYN